MESLNFANTPPNSPLLSVVVPVFRAEKHLAELYQRLRTALESISDSFEIILVEDGGLDDSWALIGIFADKDCRVKGIKLSRNFGQHSAITAGLDHAKGLWVVVMDCDLQDRPEEIPKLFSKAQEGYEIVVARRLNRCDSWLKRMWSWLFSQMLNFLTDQKNDPAVSNFGIYSRKVICSFCRMRESVRVFAVFVRWLGYRVAYLDVEHVARKSGSSNYSFRKSLELAISAIVAHSNRPLRLSIKFGFIMSASSLLAAFFLAIRYFYYAMPVPGWTSVIVSIYLLAGLFFVNIGVVGLYIGRIYDETKGRPLYIVTDAINLLSGK